MADITYQSNLPARTDWTAVWAGVFTFFAIWSVFGLLGYSIFASAATGAAMAGAQPINGLGLGIWLVVLTIIAMYVAGLETGRLSRPLDRRSGAASGMTMFGLSVVAALVIVALAGLGVGGVGVAGAASTHSLTYLASYVGWFGFVALFVGWLAAMGGAGQGIKSHSMEVREMKRPAA